MLIQIEELIGNEFVEAQDVKLERLSNRLRLLISIHRQQIAEYFFWRFLKKGRHFFRKLNKGIQQRPLEP